MYIILFAIVFICFSVILCLFIKQTPKECVKSVDEYVQFMNTNGVEVIKEDVKVVNVTIPKTFGKLYDAYAKSQEEMGYNLAKYKGKPALLYQFIDDKKNIAYSVTTHKDVVIAVDLD